ncbi:MAG: cyclic nucleotide-binding domain-containing protein, partial [Gammaproteobacteria bacterium]|nr:cyclic nucleotide-binding domain-containing protein [Gammaproteobacteria bacterium]
DLAKLLEESRRPPSEWTEEQQFEAARGLHFFNDFSDEEIHELLEVSSWERYTIGDHIISEGDLEQSFFVIVSGDVSVVIGDTEVSKLTTGDCVGELGYLSKVKRTASVIATSDVSVMKVDSNLMEWASLPCQMRFSKAFQQTLVQRLSKTTLDLATCKGAKQKTKH